MPRTRDAAPDRMTPQAFIAKWQRATLSERSACQQHFLDLCELLEHEKPAAADPDGDWFTFERGAQKTDGTNGWADVWMRGHFAWEYKGKRKNLTEAYQQLLLYREDLENPPLLVVCDLDRFEIHTNFTGTVKQVHAFDLTGLAEPANLDLLRRLFREPESLKPHLTRVGVTEAAAGAFGRIADAMRGRKGVPDEEIAHFLMKLVFCLFAEDIGLLPADLFTDLLKKGRNDRARLTRQLESLFKAMSKGGDFGSDQILWFNGGLFADARVLDLTSDAMHELIAVADQDWSQVEPSIFGTLFERLLDPTKRAQIGAHYTGKQDILTLVEPVLMAPLRREWRSVRDELNQLRAGPSKLLIPSVADDDAGSKPAPKARRRTAIARRFGISEPTLYRYRDLFLDAGQAGLTAGSGAAGDPLRREVLELKKQLEQRGQVIGEITIANQVLKKLSGQCP